MGITLRKEEGGIRVLEVAGILNKLEFDSVLAAEVDEWTPQTRVKLLVLSEGFQGWERNEDWGDLSFFLKYGDQIDRIAIVGDPSWETELLIFAAAGFRRAPVQFFPLQHVESARAWLTTSSDE